MEYTFEGTQGEWRRKDTESYAEIISEVQQVPVALVANVDDANLIAAAPDLLNTCITLDTVLRPLVNNPCAEQVMDQLQQAIHKALNIQP